MLVRKNRTLLALFSALLSGSALTFSHPSQACSAQQYVVLRRKYHCDRSLTLAAVHTDPSRYVTRVLELNGTLTCKAETESGIMISLAMADHSAPMLDVPKSEADALRDAFTPRLRVLVQVGDGSSGTVAPLKVLAVANGNEVEILDREAEAHMQFEARQQALHDARNARSGLSYRGGGYHRGPDAADGDATAQAQYYVPRLDPHVRNCFVPYFMFIADHNRRLDSKTVGKITYNLLRFAWDVRVDPRLIVSMVVAESDFDPHSTSRAGAMGLGQLMPDEARGFGLNDPYDVEQNLYGAIQLLRRQLDSFAGKANPDGTLSSEQIQLAMAAYNAGIGAVKKYGGIPPYRETQGYVRKVESLYRQLCSGDR